MSNTAFSTLISIIILGIIVVYIFIKYRKSSDEKSKEALKKFEDSLKNKVEDFIVKYIDATDFSKFTNLTDAQISILNNLYDQVWDIVVNELTDLAKTDPVTTALIKKALTRENVEAFAKGIFDSYKSQSAFAAKYDANLEANVKESLKLEKETLKEGRDYDEGLVKGDSTETEFDKDQKKVEEEKSKLNPPKDEETEVYSSDDNSVEVINEIKSNDNYIDTLANEFNKEDE